MGGLVETVKVLVTGGVTPTEVSLTIKGDFGVLLGVKFPNAKLLVVVASAEVIGGLNKKDCVEDVTLVALDEGVA